MSGKKASEFSGEEQQQVIAEFERLTRDAAAVQPETLRRILDENAGVEYLQGLGLDGRTDPDTFRACVPLATHDDLEPYIARLADGDTSPVLTAKPITSISLRFVQCMHGFVALFRFSAQPFLVSPIHAAPARRRGGASTCPSTTSYSS
jgi:hypothetical protein